MYQSCKTYAEPLEENKEQFQGAHCILLKKDGKNDVSGFLL